MVEISRLLLLEEFVTAELHNGNLLGGASKKLFELDNVSRRTMDDGRFFQHIPMTGTLKVEVVSESREISVPKMIIATAKTPFII